MSYSLLIVLQGLPNTTNASNIHWRLRHKNTVKWKSAVISRCVQHGLPPDPLAKAKITITRHSAKECDFDGLVSAGKSLLDGLTAAGVIKDDKVSVIGQPTYLWEFAKMKQGHVTIMVEELT